MSEFPKDFTEKDKQDFDLAEAMDFRVIAATLQGRQHVAVPKQYFDLFKRIATTGWWPTLYDADGKIL